MGWAELRSLTVIAWLAATTAMAVTDHTACDGESSCTLHLEWFLSQSLLYQLYKLHGFAACPDQPDDIIAWQEYKTNWVSFAIWLTAHKRPSSNLTWES